MTSDKIRKAILVGLVVAAVVIPNTELALGQGGTWTTKASMPTALANVGVGIVNNILYAVGTSSNSAGTVEAYNPVTDSWTTKAPMPTALNYPGVGVVNGVLYAVGGADGPPGWFNTVQAYNPATDSWTTKAPMPTATSALGVGVVNNILYAVGGYAGYFVNANQAYNPVTDSWTTKTPMPTARLGLGVGVVNGTLYAVGGCSNFGCSSSSTVSTVEAYNPVTDSWTTKTPMPTARYGLAVGVVSGILYAVGGINGTTYLNTVEAYDPSTDTWTTKASMPTPRESLGVGVVNGTLYAVGGYNGTFLATNEAFTPGPGSPATLILSPAAATNPVGTSHTVTATVKDATGQPVPGVTVRFRVTGSVTASGSCVTDLAGQCSFTYQGPALPGADTITAFADTNNNGVQDPGEPAGAATKTWVLPTTTPNCDITITNGGWIVANNGDMATFGGNAKSDGTGQTSGQETYQDHGPAQPMSVKAINVLAIVCDGTSQASIYGEATINGSGSFFYRIKVMAGGAGVGTYWILLENGYDSGQHTLGGGNVRISRQ